MSLVVTGSIGIDTVETPDGERREEVMGGSCAYFAAASSIYAKTRMVAVAGDDFPAGHRATLERFGIDLAGLEIRKGKTFRWGGRYLENMDRRETLFTDLNVLGGEPARIPEAYKDSSFVFLANAPPAVQHAMLREFPRRKLAVADTMDLWIGSARDELIALIREVDGLVLNYDEAEEFTGKRNTVAAAKEILALGPRFVVVKKGEHGCLFVHRDGIGALPAYPAERVVDPTGAGDTFAGGMMGFLAAQDAEDPGSFESVRMALAHGTVMASFTIEAFSLERLERLTKEELSARLDEYERMLHLR